MLSLFWRRFFLSLGQKNIFSVELLRLLVSVNNDFLKFFIFEVPKKLVKKFYFLAGMLQPLSVCWAYTSGTDVQAEHTCKALVRMLSIRLRNWRVCSVYASVFPFFKWPFVIEVPTNHAEHTRKELVRMLSIRVRNWCVCWAYASVPYAYAQHARQAELPQKLK